VLSQVRARAWAPANAAIAQGRGRAMQVAQALHEVRRSGPVAAHPGAARAVRGRG
jgi:hypothetical protein